MERNGKQFSVWSERFKEDWRYAEEAGPRLERGVYSLDELLELLERISDLNGADLDGLVILQSGATVLHLNITPEALTISDPEDPNYQNVTVNHEEVATYLAERFQMEGGEKEGAAIGPTPSKSRYAIFALLTLIFMMALFFLINELGQDGGFLPVAEVDEILKEDEVENLMFLYQGVYSTEIADGAMLLELQEDGDFYYCDIHQEGPGRYWAEAVTSGRYRPVYEEGKVALLTDSRFLLYPEQETIHFQGRVYTRLGKGREEVPYVSFKP